MTSDMNINVVVEDSELECARCEGKIRKGDWATPVQKYEGKVSTGIIGQDRIHAFSETKMVHMTCPTPVESLDA